MKKITLKVSFLFLLGMTFSGMKSQTKIYIDEKFQSTDISSGTVQMTDKSFTQYNYTADINGGVENWLNTTTPPTTADKTNAVSIHAGSTTTQFAAASVSSHQAIRIAGSANLTTANAGIYFTGLDLTGQTTLYFKFDIWGGNPVDDADIEETLKSWTINLNHGNSSTAFSLSDSYFAAGTNVTQNILVDITNGTTNPTSQTSFDIPQGQWVTISGTIDLTGKTLGTFAALQVQTDTGGFISGGKPTFAIDNVYVANENPSLFTKGFVGSEIVKVYPNPVQEQLFIQNPNAIVINEVLLLDTLGKQVYQSKLTSPIDVRKFAKGIYILKLKTIDGGVLSQKVIVN